MWEEVLLDYFSSAIQRRRDYGDDLAALLQTRVDCKLLNEQPSHPDPIIDMHRAAGWRGMDRRKVFLERELPLFLCVSERLERDREIFRSDSYRLPQYSDFCAGSLDPMSPPFISRYGAMDNVVVRTGDTFIVKGVRCLWYTVAAGEPTPLVYVDHDDPTESP